MIRASLLLVYLCLPLFAQTEFYAGALTGISTLSADARSSVNSTGSAASLYKPANGPILNVFGGLHVNNYLSLQANYTGNRNNLILTSIRSSGSAYEQRRSSSQHSFAGDVAVYFRNRRSWARPYLSVGVGATRFKSESVEPNLPRGELSPPPNKFSNSMFTFRTAVGIDLALARGWAFRYSFVEAIERNPISQQLTPPGQRNLASFQNLFGFFKTFGRTR